MEPDQAPVLATTSLSTNFGTRKLEVVNIERECRKYSSDILFKIDYLYGIQKLSVYLAKDDTAFKAIYSSIISTRDEEKLNEFFDELLPECQQQQNIKLLDICGIVILSGHRAFASPYGFSCITGKSVNVRETLVKRVVDKFNDCEFYNKYNYVFEDPQYKLYTNPCKAAELPGIETDAILIEEMGSTSEASA